MFLFRRPVLPIVVAAFVLAGFGEGSLLSDVGHFLVVQDQLQPAAVIIALAGEGNPPSREIEAARLYRAGWAPLVLVVRGSDHLESAAWESTRENLLSQGVRDSAIIIVKENARNTFEELAAAFHGIDSKDQPVILVTSKNHTRRTRLTWEYVTGGRSQAIVRAEGHDSFDPKQWWHEQRNVSVVAHEYLGIINAYAGFPISGWSDVNQISTTLTNLLATTRRAVLQSVGAIDDGSFT